MIQTQAVQETPFYNSWQLEKLTRAVKPQYIHLLDSQLYRETGQKFVSGVLFSIAAPDAEKVEIAGAFNHWRPVKLRRNIHGVWWHVQTLAGEYAPGRKSLLYKFRVDGIWQADTTHDHKVDDGYGSFYSQWELGHIRESKPAVTWRKLPNHFNQFPGKVFVEFRINRPDAQSVFLVGSFNSWNPDHDAATLGQDGIWRIRKYLDKGQHLYNFIVDGKWTLDDYNPTVKLDSTSGVRSSLLNLNGSAN